MGFLAGRGVSQLPRTPELNAEQRKVPARTSSRGAPQEVPPEATLATRSGWRLWDVGADSREWALQEVTEGGPHVEQRRAHDPQGHSLRMNPVVSQEGQRDREVVGVHSQGPQLLRVLWVRLPTTCPYHPPSPASSPPTPTLASVFHKSQFPSSSEGKEWTGRPRRSGQASLTFPQRVQAVEHELVDGAADGAVVQRGRAAPSGQHG